eukprot:TRINITY_DN2100_c0_g1_i2.p1 TRINITY_DN2100_c0_g1~~TRINITY_DN2100_c0_g1_i2.p1  ORF type:complete len:104 (+),score=15.43 TRINITY_DN2100_c0_g1_i2:87-398(+)
MCIRDRVSTQSTGCIKGKMQASAMTTSRPKRTADDMYDGVDEPSSEPRDQVIVKECSWFTGKQKFFSVFKPSTSVSSSPSSSPDLHHSYSPDSHSPEAMCVDY